MTRTNEFGQAIGEELPVGWQEPIIPDKKLFWEIIRALSRWTQRNTLTSYSRQIIVILMSQVGPI